MYITWTEKKAQILIWLDVVPGFTACVDPSLQETLFRQSAAPVSWQEMVHDMQISGCLTSRPQGWIYT